MKWSYLILPVLLVGLVQSAAAVNLTFSGSVTVIPTTVGHYYDEIGTTNLSWVSIGEIVPKPLVDVFGGNEFAWRLTWFSVIGILFVIMFGRQRNVIIPLLVSLVMAFFMVERFTAEGTHIMYAFMIAAAMGVIVYMAISRR